MRNAICLLAAVAAVSFGPVSAKERKRKPVKVTAEARDAAIAKAMKYLDNELWKLQDGGSPYRQYSLATAGWAYLLAADRGDKGSKKLPSRKKQLERIRDELARYVARVNKLYGRDDKAAAKKRRGPDLPAGFGFMRTSQYVWPLGICGHFFAESAVRGKGKSTAKKALKGVVEILEACQQPNGGWGHDDASRPGMGLPPIKIPKPGGGQLTYPKTLLAASHCALSGLGVALQVMRIKERESLDKGRRYFANSQDKGGTFPYDPSQKQKFKMPEAMGGALSVARTPGAVFALFCAGAGAKDPVVVAALKAIDKKPELMSEGHGSATMALQFGALLSRARGPAAWATFRKIFFPRILAQQDADGSFNCVAKGEAFGVTNDTKPIPELGEAAGFLASQGKVYVTAIHTLILLMDRSPPRVLPRAPGLKGPITPSARR